MPIHSQCGGCQGALVADDDLAGKFSHCPSCGLPYQVSALAAALSEPNSSPSADELNPYAAPLVSSRLPGKRYRHDHRGGLLVFLSIIGLMVCDILTFATLYMAYSDLSDMKAGVMNPAGRGLTIAALVIALVKSVFVLLAIALFLLNEALYFAS